MQYSYTVVTNPEAAAAAPRPAPNPVGLAGGILGIVAASLGLILGLFIPFIVAPLSAIAVALSAVGLRRANRDGAQKGWAVAGLSTAIPSLVLSSIWLAVMIVALASGA